MSDSAIGLAHGVVGTQFKLWALERLFVRVQVADLPRTAMLELKFVNPIGEVILEEHTLFSADPTIKTMDDPLLGAGANVFTAQPIAGGFALDRWITVGGSVLWRAPVHGSDWLVQASVTGVPGMLTSPLQLVPER
jgi:hypothetical protein